MPHLLRVGNLFSRRFTLTVHGCNRSQPNGPLPCKIEHEQSLGVTFSVFCQHRGVSRGLKRQNKENNFFRFFDHFTYFLSPFLETTIPIQKFLFVPMNSVIWQITPQISPYSFHFVCKKLHVLPFPD